jgi:pyruvate dehydrogenase E1 component alpha subunit
MSDPAKYRTKDELNEYKEQDPIILLKKRMLDAGHITEEAFQILDKKIKQEVEESVKFSEQSPQPPLESRFEDVLA